jgi:glycolate oxidase
MGGAVSGEHGVGTEKAPYFLETADPAALELMRSIKTVFDPKGILGPHRMLGMETS